MKKIIFAISILATLSSCVTVQKVSLMPATSNEADVFLEQKPQKAYKEMSWIEASGSVFHSNKKLLKKLREKAKADGSDAVIQVKFDHVFWWPRATGICIKYIN